MRDKILYHLLDILKALRPPMLVAHNSHPPDRYLVMLDECAHPTKGGLERGEPIGGLFRDIEEYLHTVHNPLLVRWEPYESRR